MFFRFLNFHRVEFMLMGGAALAYHGLRPTPDSFKDLDILINPTRSNAARFAEAMNAAAFAAGKIITQKFDPNLMAKQHAKFVPDRNELDCEFVAFLRPNQFDEALKRAESPSFSFMRVPVMGLKDLLARKNEAIQDQQRRLDEIQENLNVLKHVKKFNGICDFSSVSERNTSPHALLFMELLSQGGGQGIFLGNRFAVDGKTVDLKWLYPLEIFLPCDGPNTTMIKSAVRRALGLDGSAPSVDVLPGSKFRLHEKDDSLHCRIASSLQEFEEATRNSKAGVVLGRNVRVANFEVYESIFAEMARDAWERLSMHRSEAERIEARLSHT